MRTRTIVIAFVVVAVIAAALWFAYRSTGTPSRDPVLSFGGGGNPQTSAAITNIGGGLTQTAAAIAAAAGN